MEQSRTNPPTDESATPEHEQHAGVDEASARQPLPLPARWAAMWFGGTVAFFLIAGSYLAPDIEPGRPITPVAVPAPDGSYTLTFDVSDRDTWISVDLGQGKVVEASEPADLRVRRYTFQAPQGAARLKAKDLSHEPPAKDLKYDRDVLVDGEFQSPALDRWYEYGLQSHLLSPKQETYAVRRAHGGTATIQVVSYYCEPEGSGCMTLRYLLHGP